MGKLKLMTIIGTRPEIIRLSATIKCCDRYFEQILVHTGQNYDYTLNQVFFDDLGLRAPDYYLDAAGDDLGATIGNIVERSYKLMVRVRPDAVLVLGDTNSCLAVIGAKRLHIPIFHMEAGNRCKDECLPEETNRRIVDIISDVNMAYSEHARRYLAECGLPKERTYVTGSPMAEVLHENFSAIKNSDILGRLGLRPRKYILLSAHREENIDTEKNFLSLFNAINKMAEGPFPEHYEPFETPLGTNPLHPNVISNPAARIFKDDAEALGKADKFPYVGTTYRLTEHFHYWTKHALLNAILQPEQFVEIGESLANKLGIAQGDTVKVSSNRGYIKAKAVVTKRIRTLKANGKDIDTIGIPIHWGYEGVAKKGFIANTLTPFVGDANTQTPEFKSFLVNVEKV